MPIGVDLSVLSFLGFVGAGAILPPEATRSMACVTARSLERCRPAYPKDGKGIDDGVITDFTGCCGIAALRRRAV